MSNSDVAQTPEQRFWAWFVANEERLFHFDRDREAVFDLLGGALSLVHKDLTFELGPVSGGRRQFTISAGGIKGAFPAVVALADHAPPLDRWEIVRFRQRHRTLCDIELNGLSVRVAEVEFSLLRNGDAVGICLYLPGYSEARRVDFRSIGYLMLDQALGEFDVETKIGAIEMSAPPASMDVPRHPLKNLAKMFDELWV